MRYVLLVDWISLKRFPVDHPTRSKKKKSDIFDLYVGVSIFFFRNTPWWYEDPVDHHCSHIENYNNQSIVLKHLSSLSSWRTSGDKVGMTSMAHHIIANNPSEEVRRRKWSADACQNVTEIPKKLRKNIGARSLCGLAAPPATPSRNFQILMSSDVFRIRTGQTKKNIEYHLVPRNVDGDRWHLLVGPRLNLGSRFVFDLSDW